jgi:hypothetical protein
MRAFGGSRGRGRRAEEGGKAMRAFDPDHAARNLFRAASHGVAEAAIARSGRRSLNVIHPSEPLARTYRALSRNKFAFPVSRVRVNT